MISKFSPSPQARFLAPLLIITSAIHSESATVTTTTIQHATVTKTGATADDSIARFATYYSSLGYTASYLVMDFEFAASSFGSSPLDDISQATLSLTHASGLYTAGRFDVYYVENTAPSIATGSTQMLFDEMSLYGFNLSSPPPYLSGLTKVATSFYTTGILNINLDLSSVESAMITKINAGEKIRFVFTESTQVDNTVSAWSGLGNDHSLAPRFTVTGVPEPGSFALFSASFLFLGCFRQRLKR